MYILEVKRRVEDWTDGNVMMFTLGNVTNHTLSGDSELEPLTSYDVRVQSVNFNGPSNFSIPAAMFSTFGECLLCQ